LQDLKKALELSRQEYDYSQLDQPVVPENEESTPAGIKVNPSESNVRKQTKQYHGMTLFRILTKKTWTQDSGLPRI
jgi:hypothetical protein